MAKDKDKPGWKDDCKYFLGVLIGGPEQCFDAQREDRADRQDARREDTEDVKEIKQEGKTERVYIRQGGRTNRAEIRGKYGTTFGQQVAGIGEGLLGALGAGIGGAASSNLVPIVAAVGGGGLLLYAATRKK